MELEADGHDVEALDKLPSLTGLEFYWSAWVDLNTCRQIGMALGPIPWTAIQEYADRHGMTPDDRYLLERVIAGLEKIQSDINKEQQEKQKQKAQSQQHRHHDRVPRR